MKNFKNYSLLCLSQKGFKGDNKNIVIKQGSVGDGK